MNRVGIPRLGPYICEACQHRSVRHLSTSSSRYSQSSSAGPQPVQTLLNAKHVKQRIKELGGLDTLQNYYPRWRTSPGLRSAREAKKQSSESFNTDSLTTYGRVKARRKQSSRLVFYDIESGNGSVQVMVDAANIPEENQDKLKSVLQRIKSGDWIAIVGEPCKTNSGESTVKASEVPMLVSPSLQPIPLSIENTEVKNHNRHVDRLIDPTGNNIIRLRHALIRAMRSFFEDRNFIEVNTPLLTAGAGGAAARPFETTATEFGDLTLNLRIAPELFLKRLVVGGIDRVFEIGPAFRNEGVDGAHNPEFHICEYYQAFADLETLMADTETLFARLASVTERLTGSKEVEIVTVKLDPRLFSGNFNRIAFIPTLEREIRRKSPHWTFPDLSSPDVATSKLLEPFDFFDIAVPSTPTLPRLLDALAGHLLEPYSSQGPTWLTHHPECMSPLAKSFTDASASTSGFPHPVAARAELFIAGREYVNCYEEENDPVSQRRKFEEQIRLRIVRDGGDVVTTDGEVAAAVDESYVSALEWGLPPTGGWGCGIDRLVMLFSGRTRIADVLPFGTLNNVLALGNQRKGK